MVNNGKSHWASKIIRPHLRKYPALTVVPFKFSWQYG